MQSGVDIVKVSRFEKDAQNEKFLKKYFTSSEVEYLLTKLNKTETLAGLFAAKEAVLKALGLGIGRGIDLIDINILHDIFGAPFVEITPKINFYLMQKNCCNIALSISHDDEYAIAFCVIN